MVVRNVGELDDIFLCRRKKFVAERAVFVERFLQRTIRMGYLSPALPDAAVLVAEAETRLLASVALRPHHFLRPLFPPVIIRRPGLRPRPHNFVLPDKDDCNFIPRIL